MLHFPQYSNYTTLFGAHYFYSELVVEVCSYQYCDSCLYNCTTNISRYYVLLGVVAVTSNEGLANGHGKSQRLPSTL